MFFKEEDLKDTGVELDSHITLLYAQGKRIEHVGLLSGIKEILGDEDWRWLEGMIRGDEFYSVLDLFELGSFENDSDYLVLKLRKGSPLFKVLSLINKGLSIKEALPCLNFAIAFLTSHSPNLNQGKQRSTWRMRHCERYWEIRL